MPTNQILCARLAPKYDGYGLLNFVLLNTNTVTEQDQTFSATYRVNTALLANHILIHNGMAVSIHSTEQNTEVYARFLPRTVTYM